MRPLRRPRPRTPACAGFFAFLVEEEELTRSPIEKFRPPAVPDVPVPVLSDDELRRLFATCAVKTYVDRRDTAMMRLSYDTGMRRSELSDVEVSDVDLDEQIAVVLGKGRRPRACPFGMKICTFLDRHHRATPATPRPM